MLVLLFVLFFLNLTEGTSFNGSNIVVNSTNGPALSIECNDGSNCNVVCDGENICKDGIINCPTDSNCDITCNGENACYNVTFNCPQSSSLECNIDCGQDKSTCEESYMNAENTGTFDLICNGNFGCDSAIINNRDGDVLTITNTIPPELQTRAVDEQWQTFLNAQIFCPIDGNCYITIDTSYGGMSGTTINANQSDFIEIRCNNYDEFSYDTFDISSWNTKHIACSGTSIDAKFATKLTLYGGPGAFGSCNIICPDHIDQTGYGCEFYGVRLINNWINETNTSYGDINEKFGLFGTFSNIEVVAKEGINDIGLFCDDKVYEHYGEIDIDWVFYDENGEVSSAIYDTYYYDTWAMGCLNDAHIGCGDDTNDLGEVGDDVTNECWMQLVKRDSYRIHPDGNYTNNQNGRPTDDYKELDWICASLISDGETDLSSFVSYTLTFNFYCFDQNSSAPSLSPSLEPSISPSYVPTEVPSIQPSISPSNIPSNQPTIQPSNIPTVTPSMAPTGSPTIATTEDDITSSMSITPPGSGEQKKNNKNNCGFCGCNGLICIIIGIILGMGLSVGVCCFCWQFLKYREARKDQDMSSRDLRLQTISGDGNNTTSQ